MNPPELQGRSSRPVEPYLVGREKIREFARAVFATNPIHLDVEAARAAGGYADVIAPPTFAVVVQEQTLAQLLAAPDAASISRASCTATSGSRRRVRSSRVTSSPLS